MPSGISLNRTFITWTARTRRNIDKKGSETLFYKVNRAFDQERARRNDFTGPRSSADFIHWRATGDIRFNELFQADFLIHMKRFAPQGEKCLGWFPRLVFLSSRAGMLPLFARATTAKGIMPFQQILRVGDLRELYGLLHKALNDKDIFGGARGLPLMRTARDVFNLDMIEQAVKGSA